MANQSKKAAQDTRSTAPVAAPGEADVRAAVAEGAVRRVRPILMTVATIFAGLLPIMLGSGTGAEVMQRIAAPMVGGMASATVLTLVMLPAVWVLRLRARMV